MNFDKAIAFALTLPDTERGTSYGQPAVKVASNGRAFLFPSHETETSFGIAIDLDTIEILQGASAHRIVLHAVSEQCATHSQMLSPCRMVRFM